MKKLISKFVLSLAFAASVFADPDISKISNSSVSYTHLTLPTKA